MNPAPPVMRTRSICLDYQLVIICAGYFASVLLG
jgi:hypothetical protein